MMFREMASQFLRQAMQSQVDPAVVVRSRLLGRELDEGGDSEFWGALTQVLAELEYLRKADRQRADAAVKAKEMPAHE